MRELWALFQKRVFWQVYRFVLIFILVPVTVWGFLYYKNSTDRLLEEYRINCQNLLDEVRITLDKVIESVSYSSNQIHTDQRLMQIIRKKGELTAFEKGDVIERLIQIKNSSKYIYSVVLVQQQRNQVFCTEYGFSRLSDFPDQAWFGKTIDTAREVAIFNSRPLYQSSQSFSRKNVITLCKQINFSAYGPKAYLAVNIDPVILYSDILKRIGEKFHAEVFLVSRQYQAVIANPEQPMEDLIGSDQFRAIINSKASGMLERDGTEGMVFSAPSEYLDSQIVWISSPERLYALFGSVRNISIISCLAIILLFVPMALLVTGKTLKPLDDTLEIVCGGNRSQQPLTNLFRFINHYIRDMRYQNHDLQEKLGRMFPVYQERLLYRLLSASGIEPEDGARRLAEYNIYFRFNNFYVMTFETIIGKTLAESRNRNVVQFELEGVIDQELRRTGLEGYRVSVDGHLVSLVLNIEDIQPGDKESGVVRELAWNICKTMAERHNIQVVAGASGRGVGVAEWNRLYHNSLMALKHRVLDLPEQVIFADELETENSELEKYQAILDNKLEELIIAGEEEPVIRFLVAFFRNLRDERKLTEVNFQFFMFHLLSVTVGLGEKLNLNASLISDKRNFLEEYKEIKTLDEAEVYFASLIQTICGRLKDNRQKMESRHVGRIVQYIEEHSSENFGIETMAEQLNVSSSYIYKIFREQFRKTFIEYLHEIRLQKACRLLESPEMKIGEIASRTGFSSANYFIQVFRKYKGYTPNEYRKLQQISGC